MSDTLDPIQSHQEEIQADKILLIHDNLPLMLIGTSFATIPLGIALWNDDNAFVLTGWIIAMQIVMLLRWLHAKTLSLPNATPRQVFAHGKVYQWSILLTGSLWGSTGILFFDPNDIASFTFLLLILISMTSGSMTSLSSKPTFYAMFAVPSMLPIIINLYLLDETYYLWMALGASAYLLASLLFSRNLYLLVDTSLKRKYENLDLVQDLKKQTNAANKANQDKTRFLAASSHDLRQPLHAINLFVEVLNNKITIKDQRQDLKQIRLGLDSLTDLFDALLDISRLDSGDININVNIFNIDELIQKVRQQHVLETDLKGIQFNAPVCQQTVQSDPILLERIIRNLTVNAIRYTHKGSISIECFKASDVALDISIKDTGIGIPEDQLDDICSEFTQLHNPERDRKKGLGLGLAIVKRITSLLNHPFKFNSQINKGSVFTIQVPLCPQEEVSGNPAPISFKSNTLKGLRVLVIDNEISILKAMQPLLESWQCQFIGAKSSQDALELIEDGLKPEFILADYRLPGTLNGCQLVTKILQQIKGIPVLIISGDTDSEVIKEIKQEGYILLNKPIKPAQLRLAMNRLVQQ